MEGENFRALNPSVVHYWNRLLRGAMTAADMQFVASQQRLPPCVDGDGRDHVATERSMMLTSGKVGQRQGAGGGA